LVKKYLYGAVQVKEKILKNKVKNGFLEICVMNRILK